MKKRIFGIKVGRIFSTLLCLIAAILFWFFAKYAEANQEQSVSAMASFISYVL